MRVGHADVGPLVHAHVPGIIGREDVRVGRFDAARSKRAVVDRSRKMGWVCQPDTTRKAGRADISVKELGVLIEVNYAYGPDDQTA